jgi:hypothetical protein
MSAKTKDSKTNHTLLPTIFENFQCHSTIVNRSMTFLAQRKVAAKRRHFHVAGALAKRFREQRIDVND